MSDIYLQITETPTVVTLSAPVVSGALAATVTVANVVTVALDSNSLSALENVTVTVGAAVSISNFPSTQTIAGTVTANIGSATSLVGGGYPNLTDLLANETIAVRELPNISGTVEIQPQQSDDTDPNIKFIPIGYASVDGGGQLDQWTAVDQLSPLPVYFPANNPIPAGTNRIGVVTIGGGTVTIGAGASQIGSVTAFLTYSQTAVSLSSTAATAIPIVFPTNGVYGGSLQGYNGTNTYIYSGIQAIGNTSLASATSLPVSLGSLPALVAGTAQIGSVTASISNSVTIGSLPAISGTVTANLAISSSAITSGSFTSLTSATLVPANTARKMATVYNLGTGQLFINAGATATTLGGGFMVVLNSGDFYECDYTTTTLSAIYATAGTASWMSH